MSEKEEIEWYKKVLGLSEEDVILFLENHIRDFVEVFVPSNNETSPSESAPVHATSA